MTIALFLMSSLVLMYCKKDDTITPLTGTPVLGSLKIDTSWSFEKSHSNVGWQTRYHDYSETMLTGRFNDFYFTLSAPDAIGHKHQTFAFDQTDMSKCSLNAWVKCSTNNTGEVGRDKYSGCGPGYLGVFFTDSAKTTVDATLDTAWFNSTSFTQIGTIPADGFPATYVVKGNLTFNHYRPASGNADKAPITKPVTMYLTYNGTFDYDSNNDGTNDKLYNGFTGKFSFNRSDFMDQNSTTAYFPFYPGNATSTANNTTYGVWSTSVADQMDITINVEMYKKH